MAANSDLKLDVFIWIKKVIDSTTTLKQYINTDKLIDIFWEQYKDRELYRELHYYSIGHMDNINN